MQKKLIALAVASAGLVAAPALAQTSNVVVYGIANLGVDNYSATGAAGGSAHDYKARSRVFDFGSRIGFKGKESLGNGLYVAFQQESGVSMDSGANVGQSGAAASNGSSGYLGSRASWLGLGGSWGQVRAGRDDVFWHNGPPNLLAAIGIGMPVSIVSGGGGYVYSPVHTTSNVLRYLSPKFNGFNVHLTWIANNEGVGANTDPNGKGWAAGLYYHNGPYWATYKYVTVQAAGSSEKDSAQKLILGYFYHGHSHFGLILEQNKKADITAGTAALNTWYNGGAIAMAGDTMKQNTWNVNWRGDFGPWELDAQYGQGGEVKGLTGAAAIPGETKFSEYQLAAQYHFSKRTHMYFEYGQITNKAQNHLDFVGGSMSSAGAHGISHMSDGADPRIIGIGLRHAF